jgi:O-antigen ligase
MNPRSEAMVDAEAGDAPGGSLVMSSASFAALSSSRAATLAKVSRLVDHAGLALLLLATGALLFRPSDLVPVLEGAPLYEICILCCIAVSFPRLLSQLTARSLRSNAILTVLLLFPVAVAMSHLSSGNTWDARVGGTEAAKAFLLFLLIAALVDSAAKLRAMLLALMASVTLVTALVLLNRYGLIHVESLTTIIQPSLDENDPSPIIRLCGTGMFNDPNDYALILVSALSISAWALTDRRLGRARWGGLVAIALLGQALVLTGSRGGLFSAAAACLAFLPARFGWRNALPLIGAVALVLCAPMWGRLNTLNLDNPDDTFQARLGLWSDALDVIRAAPIFGIGQGKLVDAIGQVAHNSFLHAFADLGIFGGMLFIGAFHLVARGVWRASPSDTELARLRPYMLAVIVGYAAGLLTLSRCYTVPTQLLLGLATVYIVLTSASGRVVVPRLDYPCLRRIAGVGSFFLCATYVFVRVMILRD